MWSLTVVHMVTPSPAAAVSAAVSKTVAAAITVNGLTPHRISELAQIPRTTLNRKLAGRGEFTITELALIAEALDTTIGDLIPQPSTDGAA